MNYCLSSTYYHADDNKLLLRRRESFCIWCIVVELYPLQDTHSSSNPLVPVNMTLFGNRLFADLIKLRCSHTGSRWALNPVTDVFIRRGNLYIETQHAQGRRWCEGAGRDCREAVTSPGMAEMPEAVRRGRTLPRSSWREQDPAAALMSNSWPSELWGNTFLLF